MKKLVLILLCLITFNSVFGSSQKYSAKDCYEAAYGAFIDLVDLNGKATEQERQEAEEALLDFNENVPGFKEQATKAYKDIAEEIKNRGTKKSMNYLRQFGNKYGFEDQQSNTGTTSTGKSSCCLLL